MSRRNLLSASCDGGGDLPITFIIEGDWDSFEITIPYSMTWAEFIHSEYNPIYPNGVDKAVGDKNNSGFRDGYVYFNNYDYDYDWIDMSIAISIPGQYMYQTIDENIKNTVYYGY